MAERTQKQVAEKYKGNLAYYTKPHYLRRLRGWCFVFTAVAAIAGAVTYQYWGSERLFSTGPISANHARFANDCRVCHLGSDLDLWKTLPPLATGSRLMEKMAEEKSLPGKDEMLGAMQKGLSLTSLSLMDQACMKCHPAMGLHQPQAAGLALRTVFTELAVVHATACGVCHREHVGRDRMALPTSQTCASCHGDAEELQRTRQSLKLNHPPLAATGENRDWGDGVVRFIAPERPPEALKAFTSYAQGHPPFDYEQPYLRDPADLKFNHSRHERNDIPAVQNRKMTCTDCHKPGPGGIYLQPVNFEQHCQQCHSLQIQPSLPKLLIPHGDPQKVRYFLASLKTSFENAIRAEGVSAPMEISQRADVEMESMRRRGLQTLPDLEETVFFLGDPKEDPSDRLLRKGRRKFLTECAKCHSVTAGNASTAPKVNLPNVAERWVQRGPFTHLPHQHIACTDCHGAAHKSKLTSDILMPPQTLCAECHRPTAKDGLAQNDVTMERRASLQPDSGELAAAQRSTGGVKWDCQSCHGFHAPPAATTFIQSSLQPPPPPPSGASAGGKP
ncbi:MAG: hypothetical protein QOE70_1188 [Chthoniobacter sp.]|jgi:mono/diheme cytochrome c family protein|nr:hypothetical protein [Chthoniobacter sp.]